MTESALLKHIEEGTGIPAKNGHPTYYDAGLPMHPTEPADYDEERLNFAERILGEADFVYHPALGSPHVDIHRFPAGNKRPFVCYLTSGMSDVNTCLSDGSTTRVELVACVSKPDDETDINSPDSLTQVIRYVSLYPFLTQRGLGYYHVVELPSGYRDKWGRWVLIIPPFLLSDMAFLPLMDQKVSVLSMIRIREADMSILVESGPDALFSSWVESLETWLFDTQARIPRTSNSMPPPPLPKPPGHMRRLFGKH